MEEQHLLCSQTVVPLCASLAMSAHITSLRISSAGSFNTQEETWPAMVWALVDECIVQTGPAIEACNVISRGAMQVPMPSCMFYCQITAPAQIIYCSTWRPHPQKGISTSLTGRPLQEISLAEIVCWTGYHKLQRPVTCMPHSRFMGWIVEMGKIPILTACRYSRHQGVCMYGGVWLM